MNDEPTLGRSQIGYGTVQSRACCARQQDGEIAWVLLAETRNTWPRELRSQCAPQMNAR